MTHTQSRQDQAILQRIARRAMLARGLSPDSPPQALTGLKAIHGPATRGTASTRDLRDLLWCSIDNGDSRDLDPLSVAQTIADGAPCVDGVPSGAIEEGGLGEVLELIRDDGRVLPAPLPASIADR